jgi:hypothetical protein
MTGKFKNIASLLLLLVFLLPSIIKLEHHHERIECKAKHDSHYSVIHDKCVICDFEFSHFLSHTGDIDFQKENPAAYFRNNYDSVYFSNFSLFSSLLRAPPLANSI